MDICLAHDAGEVVYDSSFCPACAERDETIALQSEVDTLSAEVEKLEAEVESLTEQLRD